MTSPRTLARSLRDLVAGQLESYTSTNTEQAVARVLRGGALEEVLQEFLETGSVSLQTVITKTVEAYSQYLGVDELSAHIAKNAEVQVQAWINATLERLLKGPMGLQAVAVAQRAASIGGVAARKLAEASLGYVVDSAQKTVIAGIMASTRLMSVGVGELITDSDDVLLWYAGPDDHKTRPYCGHLQDKVVKRRLLQRTPNGHGLDPSRHGGGYNCRHSLIPVTTRIMANNGLSFAQPSDYAAAAASVRRRSA